MDFAFPKEQSEFCTRLSLRKYSRPKPGASTTITTDCMIRFPLPQQLVDAYNINVSTTNLELLGNSPSNLLAAGKSVAEDFKQTAEAGQFGVSKILSIATDVAALAPGISDKLQAVAQQQQGIVRNPHLTTLFQGVNLKHYSFTWKISPRSADESRELNQCIKTIKQYMHPAIIGGGFALEYPYLAAIEFSVGSNDTMPNVNDSFITSFSINNSASGGAAFFNDGNPVSVELTMGFQEIDIRTRESFGGSATRDLGQINIPRSVTSLGRGVG
jgi:hypothetical protein